jgi:hypothetical protein
MAFLTKLWWIPALAAAGIVATLDSHGDAGDVIFFAHAGEDLFGRGWTDVFADPKLQSGPLQLAALGALARLSDAVGISLGTMLAFAVELGATAAALLVLKRFTSNRAVLLLAGLGVVALGLSQAAYVDGHPAQLFVPLLWVVAGLAARDGRGSWAGVLVGLSAGLELWGLLGVCVLAASPGIRSAARGLGIAALVTAGLLAPFVALGDFSMLEFQWHVASGTLVSLVVEPGSTYPWAVRLVQAATAVAAGASVAWALRARPSVVWVAPLAAILVRLLFDPVFYAAYLLAPLTLAAVGAVEFLTGDLVRDVRTGRSGKHAPGQGAVAFRR